MAFSLKIVSFGSGSLVAISATAATTPTAVATTATAATATTGARGTGLGHIDGQGSTAVLLAVQGRDSCFSFVLGLHFDKPEPFALTGRTVADDFGASDGSVRSQQSLQIGTAGVIAEVPNVQLFAHRNLLSMAYPTRCLAFRVVCESGRQFGLYGRKTILAMRSRLGKPRSGTCLARGPTTAGVYRNVGRRQARRQTKDGSGRNIPRPWEFPTPALVARPDRRIAIL